MRGFKHDLNSPRMEKNYTNQGSFPTMNRTVRVMTAVLLTMMMMLSGCLGANTDDGNGGGGIIPTAQGSTTTVVNGNYLPIVNAYQIGPLSENVSYNSTGSGTLLGMNVSVYHSAIDPDGTTLAMGWDTNLDGIVDIPVSASQGFTVLYIAISEWNTVPDTNNNSHMVSIAFHATDANGGKDVALLDLQSRIPVGPWWMSQNGFYAMSGKDAQGTPGTGTADNLIMLTMDQGGDINWAAVSVKLAIDGAAPVTCDNPGVDGTAVCSLVEFGDTDDQVWSVGDGVTVVENGQDLCGATTSCSIDVTITDTREGKVIDTTNGVVAE